MHVHPACPAAQTLKPSVPVQGMPLQQLAAVAHDWPKSEQVDPVPPLSLPMVPPSLVPPPDPGITLHVPCVEPGGTLQKLPLQQSAFTVHGPVVGTQMVPPSDPLGPA